MTQTPRQRWRPSGLGLRVMAMIGVALLPLAVLSYVQTVSTAEQAERHARAAILGETLLSATPLIDFIRQAQGTATTLATLVPTALYTPGACQHLMEQTARKAMGQYSVVGFVPLEGPIRCSAPRLAPDVDVAGWLTGRLENPRLQLKVDREGRISGTSVLSLSAPIYTPDGNLLGFVAISMPHRVLEARRAPPPRETEAPLALLTLDETGTLLSASVGLDAAPALLPANTPFKSYANGVGTSFLDTAADGGRRAFAVVPIVQGGIYVLGSWPAERLAGTGGRLGLAPWVLPALMWLASLLVAYLAAQSQMLRPVTRLRERLIAFAEGDRSLTPPDLSRAAPEVRDVGDAYERMTEAIVHQEAHLENLIHQQEALMRELHHRVKNNLQLIASILNMQLREARSEETRAAMTNVQERVISLATIHRELYQISNLADVRATDLLPQILHNTIKLGAEPGRGFDISVDIDETVRLSADQAVPLALFLTEGAMKVLKHAGGGAGAVSYIRLQLTRQSNGRAELRLENSITRSAPDEPEPGAQTAGFGHKLLLGFAHQLEGRMQRQRRSRTYALTLEFPLTPLSDVSRPKAAQ